MAHEKSSDSEQREKDLAWDLESWRRENSRSITPIAWMESCFPEKFGVPRQAGIVPAATGVIHLIPPFNHETYLTGLELSSHLWITFGFHQNEWRGRATVRPQRLGGNARMGVFATRSSFRPNGLGLSAVKIERIDQAAGKIEVSGHDLVEKTPIYCIKPYIPFADAIAEAKSDFALSPPERYPVLFTPEAEAALQLILPLAPDLKKLIEEVISQNPLPQFHHDFSRIYGVELQYWNIQFQKIDLTQEALLSKSEQAALKSWNASNNQSNSEMIGFRVIKINIAKDKIGDT